MNSARLVLLLVFVTITATFALAAGEKPGTAQGSPESPSPASPKPAVPIAAAPMEGTARDVVRLTGTRRRMKLKGTFICETAPTFFYFNAGDDTIRVRLKKQMPLKPGDYLELVGTPTDTTNPPGHGWLVDAEAKVLGTRPLPEPLRANSRNSFREDLDSRYIVAKGRVAGFKKFTSRYYVEGAWTVWDMDSVLIVCDDGFTITVCFPLGTITEEALPLGTIADFTGSCRMRSMLRNDEDAGDIQIVASSTAAIRVIETPPFWSTPKGARTLRNAGYVLAGLAGLLIFWFILRARRARLLRASEVRFRALIENSFDATVVLNPDASIKYMTPGWARLLGPGSNGGDSKMGDLSDVIHPEDLPLITDAHSEVLAAPGTTRRVADYRVMTSDGAVRHCEAIGKNCLDVPGVEGVVVNIHDVTERTLAEKELRRVNAGLEQRVAERTQELANANGRLAEALRAEKELGELRSNFVSLVSHEFRTPLEVILTSSDILDRYLDRLAPQKRHEYLRTIHESVKRMSGMMEDVLLLGRVEAGKLEFKPTAFDLPAFCRRVTDEIHSATARRCPIELRFVGDCADAQGDDSVLRYIIANLLSNAAKYSADGTPITFEVSRSGADALFTIADRGRGIPAADHVRLFESFQRGSNVSDKPGTGLGLLIVKRCVEIHGGTITFESEEGRGATFKVALPLFARPATHSSTP